MAVEEGAVFLTQVSSANIWIYSLILICILWTLFWNVEWLWFDISLEIMSERLLNGSEVDVVIPVVQQTTMTTCHCVEKLTCCHPILSACWCRSFPAHIRKLHSIYSRSVCKLFSKLDAFSFKGIVWEFYVTRTDRGGLSAVFSCYAKLI